MRFLKNILLALLLLFCLRAGAQSDFPAHAPQKVTRIQIEADRELAEKVKREQQRQGLAPGETIHVTKGTELYEELEHRRKRRPEIAQNAIAMNFGDVCNGITFTYEHSWLTNDELLRWNGRLGWGAGQHVLLDESNAYANPNNGLLAGAGLIYGRKYALQADMNFMQYFNVNRVDVSIAAGLRKQSSRGRLMTKTQLYWLPYGGYRFNYGYTFSLGICF